MDTTEIVEGNIERHGSLHVCQRLAVSVRQSRESAKVHPHIEVASFNVGRRNLAPFRLSDFDMWDRSNNLTATVPPIGIDAAIDFVKLAEIDVLSEVFTHCAHIAVVLIGRDLIAAISASAKIRDECVSLDAVASADMMTD